MLKHLNLYFVTKLHITVCKQGGWEGPRCLRNVSFLLDTIMNQTCMQEFLVILYLNVLEMLFHSDMDIFVYLQMFEEHIDQKNDDSRMKGLWVQIYEMQIVFVVKILLPRPGKVGEQQLLQGCG